MTIPRFSLTRLVACLVLALAVSPRNGPVGAANFVPSGFTESLVASGLSNPTAMQFAPDGRLFVCEQGGRLRVIADGTLLPTPFVTLPVNSAGERGLLGVAFDPAFASNQFVYVYYTATTPNIHNRISRFTANGNVAVAGSETILLELNPLSSATNHNGGALAFGPGGKLFAAVGENANGANAQSMSNLLGKMLRLNADGSIPADNPFYLTASGDNRAIWALGLRNPFTFAFDRPATTMFINDVGQNTWEEVNKGVAGANYGWPATEGTTTNPNYHSPIYAYNHSAGACAITGGAFYTPLVNQFPADYTGHYFFADYCGGWIRRLDPQAPTSIANFATLIAAPVDLKVSDAGALYYLARGGGASTGVVYRIEYGESAPSITQHPANQTVAPGGSATFSVRASGPPTLRYQWQRDGADITGATTEDYTISGVAASDNGAQFRALVSNDFGNVLSNPAILTVTANQAPTGSIVQPAAGTLYSGGSVINYSGSATDTEDGTLPASAFTWQVDFHHDLHFHPFIAPISGASSGAFTIPTTGHTESTVWYRIHMTVQDSGGQTHSSYRDVTPRVVRVTLATSPAGLQLRLDGQPVTTPFFDGVVGIVRTLEAPTPQSSGGAAYEFVSWSDGGSPIHSISTPATATTYTATYRVSGSGGTGSGLSATYFNNLNFTGTTVTRVDPTVDFAWGSGSPAPSIAADTFSARWTGRVEAQFSGAYTFYTQSDDGVRLWVNGQQLVNNWTNHATTENSGTITLVSGQQYDILMEFYENGGGATARLLWSSLATPKAVVPSTRLYPPVASTVTRVNFQPSSAPVPAGYLPDGGLVYASRGGGQSYGWNVDNTAQTRDRNASNSPDQRYDTLTHLQKPANPDGVWEIAVPNGTYAVRVVSGDAQHFDSVFRTSVEGVLTVNGTPTSAVRWVEGTSTVTVTDGRLTLRSGAGASNNKLCFIEITRQ